MPLKLTAEDYDRAVRFVQACAIDPTSWTDPVRITDIARMVLAEVDAAEKEARQHDDDFPVDYDETHDDLGREYLVSPAATFLLFVGRITGAMLYAAVRDHDRALAGDSGQVRDAIGAAMSGIGWAEWTEVCRAQDLKLERLREELAAKTGTSA